MSDRILFLIDSLNNGGAERQLALLVKYLPTEWDRRVFSLGEGPFVELIRSYGIRVDICERKSHFDPSPAFALWRLMAEWKPDVVHSWGWMSSLAAGVLCKVLGIHFIDGTLRMGKLPIRRVLVQRLGMVWAKQIIANSQAGLLAWKISPEKGRVVYNGFDPGRLVLCTPLESTPVFFTVVMVGRMSPDKDFRSFFRAARILFEKADLNWRFIAIGNGVDHSNLLAENMDLIEMGKVEIMDGGSEVLPFVCQAQVGVLLSPIGEGFSNAIMEYMACGLPVICNDTGGNRELVVDGETGFLIPVGNFQTLAEKLIYLRNNPREAERFGQAGRRRLLAHFTVETMIEKTIQIYEEVL